MCDCPSDEMYACVCVVVAVASRVEWIVEREDEANVDEAQPKIGQLSSARRVNCRGRFLCIFGELASRVRESNTPKLHRLE